MFDLVGDPNCWFSHAQAQIINHTFLFMGNAGIDGDAGSLPAREESELKSDITLMVLERGYSV